MNNETLTDEQVSSLLDLAGLDFDNSDAGGDGGILCAACAALGMCELVGLTRYGESNIPRKKSVWLEKVEHCATGIADEVRKIVA